MGDRETKRQVQRGGLLVRAHLEGGRKEADMGEVDQDKETPQEGGQTGPGRGLAQTSRGLSSRH